MGGGGHVIIKAEIIFEKDMIPQVSEFSQRQACKHISENVTWHLSTDTIKTGGCFQQYQKTEPQNI